MFNTLVEIREQLDAGEDSFAEFKEVRLQGQSVRSPNTEEFAGELVAFANADGGAVFLGVDDGGVVRGIPETALGDVEQWVINIASNNCDPPIRPAIRKVTLPDPSGADERVMLVHVMRSLYVHRTSGGRWYVRVGSTKRDLTQPELSRLFQERGRTFVFDESPVMGSLPEDIDQRLFENTLGAPRGISLEQLLLNRRVLVEAEDGSLRPTVAGLLCFCSDPSQHLPGAHIHAAVYRDVRRHSDDLVHSQDVRGPVDSQIDEAMAFVDRFMLKPARKSVGREDYPQYTLGAVHEAIVNAVAHRDYSIAGGKIRLFLYADRLEILSPGNLPNTVTVESMRFRQFTRNQLLVSFLSKMKSSKTGRSYIEERGEGVTRIVEESSAHSGREPTFALHGQELCLTIWAKEPPQSTETE